MAIGVDTSKWKPRKFKGTPAGRARNLVALGVVSVGLICGVLYQCSDITKKYRKKVEVFYEDPIEEVERKLMISAGLGNRSSDSIRRYIAEQDRTDRPDA